MNPNVGKYTYSEVKEMTIFQRYELFGCLEAEDGIRDFCLSRGLGDVYKRQVLKVTHRVSFRFIITFHT